MSPYLISALLGASAALFGSARRTGVLIVAGTLLSFASLGYWIYLAITHSIGTGAMAFLAGVGGSTVGFGIGKLLRTGP